MKKMIPLLAIATVQLATVLAPTSANANYNFDRSIYCADGTEVRWASQYPQSLKDAIAFCKEKHKGYSGASPDDRGPAKVRPRTDVNKSN